MDINNIELLQKNQEQNRAYLEEYYVIMATLIEVFYTRLWQCMRTNTCCKTTRKWIFDNISDPEIKNLLFTTLFEIKMTLDEFGELENAKELCGNASYFIDRTPAQMLDFLRNSPSTPYCFIRSKNILIKFGAFIIGQIKIIAWN
jgi:hypothetical protein